MTIQTNISEEKMKVYQEVKKILDENRVRGILEECGVACFLSNQMILEIVDAFHATYVPNKSEFWQTIEVSELLGYK